MTGHDLSLGEFHALVTKALRGTSYSWGHAHEGATAARRLATWGYPSGSTVRFLLRQADRSQLARLTTPSAWKQAVHPLCPLSVGSALSDGVSSTRAQFGQLAAPALLIPFLHRQLPDSGALWFRWAHGSMALTRAGLTFDQPLPDCASLTIEPGRTPASDPQHWTRATVEAEDLAVLEQFAHRTYAPATDESRERGAG